MKSFIDFIVFVNCMSKISVLKESLYIFFEVRFLKHVSNCDRKCPRHTHTHTCVKPSLILLCLKVLANCSSSSRSLGSSAWGVTVGTELMGGAEEGAELTMLSTLFSLCNDHSLSSRWCYSTDWGNTLLSQTQVCCETDSASISNISQKSSSFSHKVHFYPYGFELFKASR